MTIDSSLKEADHKMEQALAHLREDLSSVRTGRASGSCSAGSPSSTTERPFR